MLNNFRMRNSTIVFSIITFLILNGIIFIAVDNTFEAKIGFSIIQLIMYEAVALVIFSFYRAHTKYPNSKIIHSMWLVFGFGWIYMLFKYIKLGMEKEIEDRFRNEYKTQSEELQQLKQNNAFLLRELEELRDENISLIQQAKISSNDDILYEEDNSDIELEIESEDIIETTY